LPRAVIVLSFHLEAGFCAMRRFFVAIGLVLFPLAAKADCPSVRWNFMFGQ
jgi:hypothetical protein